MIVLIISIIYSFQSPRTDAANVLSYCGQSRTWVEAKLFCEQKGGRLMNRGTANDALFLQRTDIPVFQQIWFGQYRGLSEWIEKLGCFDQRSLGVSWYVSQETEQNSAATCQTICNSTQYFALQGKTCLCSLNNYVNSSWLTPTSNCVTKCPGNQSEFCGGSRSMTIYQKVPSNTIQYPPGTFPHFQCAMMNCSSSTNWTYQESSCQENYTALCGSGVLVNQPGSWQTAQIYCKDYGSLIGLNNMVPTCSVSGSVTREFWIGIYRSQVDFTLKDRSVRNPVLGCYSFMKETNTADPTSTFYPIEICDKQRRFPFICELPPGTTSSDGCYLPPTTPSSTTPSTASPLSLQEDDDDSLRIGLYVGLCVVLLAAIIVIMVLIARQRTGSAPFRQNDIMTVVASIRRRRKEEDNQEKTETKEKQVEAKADTTKPVYAVVNKPKPSRRQSAPEPSYRVYNKPVTSLNAEVENSSSNIGNGLSNGTYDTLLEDSQQSYQNEEVIDKQNRQPSILKSCDRNGSVDDISPRHVTIDEGYNRNPRTLSVPKKIIPVPPPVVKYPIESRGSRTYEQIGTTLL